MSVPFGFATLGIGQGSQNSGALLQILLGPDIQPGSEPSYQLCKSIFLYHPLGAKMTEGPIKLAQSQERDITVQRAPDEALKAFKDKWHEIDADSHILNVHTQSRVYGISSIVMGVEDFPSDKPVDMDTLYNKNVFFNVLDPLNTAGSLVLSQVPTSPHFQKPQYVRTYGEVFHPSRSQIVMNEQPIFIAYTTSAFGFVGRSVYQRALYPLKSFIKTMVADDMIATKLALLIAKMKAPGSIINKAMQTIAEWKRSLIKTAVSGQVATLDPDEDLAAIDMQNVDGAGTYSRNNIIRNVETSADMPAKMLDQETMVSGFGEGTEDAKRVAQYIGRIRIKMRPTYAWFDNITQYLAWNPVWYKSVIQSKYPEYKNITWEAAFLEWRKNFQAQWPSMLLEPESEEIKKEQVKLEAVVAILATLIPVLDANNKAALIQWAADCFGENKRLFPHELELDWDALEDFQEEQQNQATEMHEAALEPPEPSSEGKPKKKLPSFGDSADPAAIREQIARLHALAQDLTSPAERARRLRVVARA